MVEADFAAWIGRGSRPNSTAPASAHALTLSRQVTARNVPYDSPVHDGVWRSVAVRELSITFDGSAAEEALHWTSKSSWEEIHLWYWNGVSLCFPILLLRNLREYDEMISNVWPNLSGVGFSYWNLTGTEVDSEKCNRGPRLADDSAGLLRVGR
jgi:hypothetical protein